MHTSSFQFVFHLPNTIRLQVLAEGRTGSVIKGGNDAVWDDSREHSATVMLSYIRYKHAAARLHLKLWDADVTGTRADLLMGMQCAINQ